MFFRGRVVESTLLIVCLSLPIGARSEIVVAVIDTGIDFKSGALMESRWNNPGETGYDQSGRDKKTNGVDDDRNGFVDDVEGWDFINHSGRSVDRHGHGTHVAGLIASEFSRLGRWQKHQLRLMSLCYYGSQISAQQSLRGSIAALRYAVKQRVDIINFSGGGSEPSIEEEEILKEASQLGILVVAAAGNDGRDTTRKGYFPAGYRLPNIIAVAATDGLGRLISSSNFSSSQVAIAAVGLKVDSLLPGGRRGEMTGTSQATATVSGVAAALISYKNQRQKLEIPAAIVNHLRSAADFEKDLWGKVEQGARLNSTRAIAMRSELNLESEQRLEPNESISLRLKPFLRKAIDRSKNSSDHFDAGVRP